MESLQQLLRRVSKVGIKPAYLERVLPSWVSDYPPDSETGLIELKMLLANELGLDLDSLDEKQTVAFAELPAVPKFKRVRGGEISRLKPAASMFYSLAKTLASACTESYRKVPADPLKLREQIAAQHDGMVTLRGLLGCLWQHGIPVAHYTDWPERLARPVGMAVDIGGRPVVILGSVRKENAWHAFHAAHEIGHVALGHLGRDQMIVDDDPSSGEAGDAQEKEADQYALTLLGGPDVEVPQDGGIAEVGRSIKRFAREQDIDAGHLALRFGVARSNWAKASIILQHLEPGADAPVLINQDYASGRLDFEQLSEERQAYLRRVLAL